jgi:hypothetical protein
MTLDAACGFRLAGSTLTRKSTEPSKSSQWSSTNYVKELCPCRQQQRCKQFNIGAAAVVQIGTGVAYRNQLDSYCFGTAKYEATRKGRIIICPRLILFRR